MKGVELVPISYELTDNSFISLLSNYAHIISQIAKGPIPPKVLILNKPEKITFRNKLFLSECMSALEKAVQSVYIDFF